MRRDRSDHPEAGSRAREHLHFAGQVLRHLRQLVRREQVHQLLVINAVEDEKWSAPFGVARAISPNQAPVILDRRFRSRAADDSESLHANRCNSLAGVSRALSSALRGMRSARNFALRDRQAGFRSSELDRCDQNVPSSLAVSALALGYLPGACGQQWSRSSLDFAAACFAGLQTTVRCRIGKAVRNSFADSKCCVYENPAPADNPDLSLSRCPRDPGRRHHYHD